MSRCAIAVGSNLGDRPGHLGAAIEGLSAVGAIAGISSVYETAPIGGPEQGPFLNAAVLIDTARTPVDLLRELLLIERARGRARSERWGPRTLDLDLILFDRSVIDEPGLAVPHPQMRHRRFVLEPLLEIWPDARMPDGSAITAATESVWSQEIHRTGLVIGGPQSPAVSFEL
ncbi:MAG: 2-amino-4-hydroxy-6-hydroxymethyldihydropteridine diphosphokinase [Actinomycetota bacterium]|nr:2-amino-4-hydroxy-6-hydroxymethyldihydropteridine diphosphokinase [Actinomycetota bacterium]